MNRYIEQLEQASYLLQCGRDVLMASEQDSAGNVPDEVVSELAEYEDAIAAVESVIALLGDLVINAKELRHDPAYLSGLIEQSGMSTRRVARIIGIDDGELRGYLSGRRPWPYPVQFAIEALAKRAP